MEILPDILTAIPGVWSPPYGISRGVAYYDYIIEKYLIMIPGNARSPKGPGTPLGVMKSNRGAVPYPLGEVSPTWSVIINIH